MGRLMHYVRVLTGLFRVMPATDALKVLLHKAAHATTGAFAAKQVLVRLPGLPGCVAIRVAGSDFATFRQVFCLGDYQFDIGRAGVRNVLDCGGNVGFASLALYRAFTPEHLVVVEPDEANLAQCRRNLGQLPIRVDFVQAAVWTDNTALEVVREHGADNAAAFYVRPVPQAVPGGLTGITMASLIDRFDGDADVLKLDVEGAELGIFTAPDTIWLARVRNMFVELHGPDCVAACRRALADYDTTWAERGEVTACLDITPKRILPQDAERPADGGAA